jgi:hypothetical protein
MMKIYPVQMTTVEPTLYIIMTDNWIEITLRYIVDARQRRTIKAKLHQELLHHFQAEPSITVASTTIEIVGLPPIRGSVNQGKESYG